MRQAFIDKFAGPSDSGVPSPSAQLTQHQMCLGAVAACQPHLAEISIITPNLHYLPLSSLTTPGAPRPAPPLKTLLDPPHGVSLSFRGVSFLLRGVSFLLRGVSFLLTLLRQRRCPRMGGA